MAERRIQISIISGAHSGVSVWLHGGDSVTVGRAEDATWRITQDPYFSRYQFRVEYANQVCELVDLESRNGTLVNGARVERRPLSHADQIECGDTRFRVEFHGGEPETLDLPPPGARAAAATPTPQETATASFDAGPRKIADFELQDELGRGAVGVVYRAVQRPGGRIAAVKLMQPKTLLEPKMIQLFLREASILSTLRHPRIVEFITLGSHEGRLYLAMEYLPTVKFSETLATQSLASRTRLACGIVCRVLEGLAFAHSQGIVHRDIKPGNLLVYPTPEKRLLVKIADFGLAKNFHSAGFSSFTQENEVRGTVGFMPPEQLLDCRASKPSVDLYAAGVCLYYFLSGRMPYETKGKRSAIANILNSTPTPLATHVPDLPAGLLAAVDRALAREPEQRFASAAEMQGAVQPFSLRVGRPPQKRS